MFVVTVTFVLKTGQREAFLAPLLENARRSVELEPGCQRFDVCESHAHAEEVFLYEVYDDAAAFADHKAMKHYLDFASLVEPMVESKTVKTHSLMTSK